jgi:glycosyltransferase involved in cell wall biosynthesis
MAVIAIDGRKYFDFGIGTYIQQIVKSLSSLKTKHSFLLYVDPADKSSISLPRDWTMAEVNYGKYSLSEIGMFARRAKKDRVDVFHEPHYTLPAGMNDCSVVTIHDIIHLRFPQLFGRLQRVYSQAMVWHALKHSRFVIVDSEFTKKDILNTFRIQPDKINVIHLGVGEQYRTLHEERKVLEFRKRFDIERQFILYVGNVKPHKGIETLLSAFSVVCRKEDWDLVLAGGSIQRDPNLHSLVVKSGIEDRIKELGRLNDDDLVTAYHAAAMLVMPSRYEGFGLPALEAMACGTPVIVSDAASLPEIVGDAAIVFKVGNVQELADGFQKLTKQPALRQEMVHKGIERAKTFTWKKTAERTLDIYERIVGQ